MYLGNSGILWMATDNGLWRQDEGGLQLIKGFGEVMTIYESTDSTLWVGAEDELWYQEGDSWQLLEDFDYGGVSAIYESRVITPTKKLPMSCSR